MFSFGVFDISIQCLNYPATCQIWRVKPRLKSVQIWSRCLNYPATCRIWIVKPAQKVSDLESLASRFGVSTIPRHVGFGRWNRLKSIQIWSRCLNGPRLNTRLQIHEGNFVILFWTGVTDQVQIFNGKSHQYITGESVTFLIGRLRSTVASHPLNYPATKFVSTTPRHVWIMFYLILQEYCIWTPS